MLRRLIILLAAGITLYHLYAALAGNWPFTALPPVGPYQHRHLHLGSLLVLLYLQAAITDPSPWRRRLATMCTLLSCFVTISTIVLGEGLLRRSINPAPFDLAVGATFILLTLDAGRRTNGWVIPLLAAGFVLYGLFGSLLPQPWGHRGYSPGRLLGHLFMTPEGLFGTPIAVSATLIFLFGVYGSVLIASGAAEHFIALSLRLFGQSRRGAVRSVTLASFLLGAPSGSGVATTTLVGNVAYPLLARNGYSPTQAGALLAAGGLGAVLSPPILGSAAFVLAEFAGVSYLDVLRMVLIPTAIYYLWLLVVADLVRPAIVTTENVLPLAPPARTSLRATLLHIGAISSVLLYLGLGLSAEISAVFATVTAVLCWVAQAGKPPTLGEMIVALSDGAKRSIGIAAVCACAGLMIGVMSLTGLGLKLGGILTYYSGSDMVVIAILSVGVTMLVGLAVPVTGSYIICAVIVAPALTGAGVPLVLAHMFIFYFALLSEVSPPTAMAPFAAAAITGGDPTITTLQTWRYVASIALLALVLVVEPLGGVLLLDFGFVSSPLELGLFVLSYVTGSVALVLGLAAAESNFASRVRQAMRLGAALLLLFPNAVGMRLGIGTIWPLATGLVLLGLTLVPLRQNVYRVEP